MAGFEVSTEGGIWRVPVTGGAPEAVITVADGESAHGPQLLPGGEWVLFTLRPPGVDSWDDSQIVMESLRTGERVIVIEGGRDARYLNTGHIVYVLDNTLLAVSFDLDTQTLFGSPEPLVQGVRSAVPTGAAHFSIADNGSLVFIPGLQASTFGFALAWASELGELSVTEAPIEDYEDVRVSPDGTRVAVVIDQGGNADLWIWSTERGLTKLTFFEGDDGYPVWSPDGFTCRILLSP